jgi:glycosyltransferase involved in cell wall biosynthesis
MRATELLNNVIPSTTIIIPAYNEEGRIGRVLEEIADFVIVNNLKWDVIVSIDGSDKTEEIVKRFSEDYAFIKYERGKGRSGKGNAIKRVVKNSTGEFTLTADADGAISFEDIFKGYAYCDGYDAILFDRYSNERNEIPLHRRIPSRGFNILVRIILGLNVRDTQCGYKLIRTNLVKEAFGKIAVTNTFFDVALLYHIKNMGGRIKEIDVKYSHNVDSKFNIMSEIIGQGVSLFAFRLRHSKFYKYVPHWATELYIRKFRWI